MARKVKRVKKPIKQPEVVVEDKPIILHFSKPVEIQINGKRYEGKDVKVPNYSVAAEVARIAKEAYGPEIL